MTEQMKAAGEILRRIKGDKYVFGLDCLDCCGALAAGLGRRVAVVAGGTGKPWGQAVLATVTAALRSAGAEAIAPIIPGAGPNSPRADVFRIAEALRLAAPDVILAVGAGSVIDATKAASALATLGHRHADIDAYFGVGKVTGFLRESGRALAPLVAVQLAASSASHLTKYANVTDPATAQKMLIVDEAVVPARAVFDYRSTVTMSADFTADGAMDGLAHCLEVLYGAKGAALEQVREISALGIELIATHAAAAWRDGTDPSPRVALGLATDLGGLAIMIGGTSGAHLTSFSLVDVLSHGRACALMNPYYTVFFAPAIEPQLRLVADILRRAGHLRQPTDALGGRELGLAVAAGLQALAASLNMPTRLADVPGFTDAHVQRALTAARNPQLDSKLRNMPVPLSADTVGEYMRPVLEAARTGDFALIRNMKA
jgi:alcohol dehydrogenase class IV